MKKGRIKVRTTRRGAMVLLLIILLGTITFTISLLFAKQAVRGYAAERVASRGLQASMLARAGFQSGMKALKSIPEEFLFQSGIALNPPPIELEGCKDKCFISYRIQPEDGKLNLNSLVNTFDDRPNPFYKNAFDRLFTQFNIPIEVVDATVDWIDLNNFREGLGAESNYYSSLVPPRKIKNFYMYSLAELSLVRGVKPGMIYESMAPEGWQKLQSDLKFQTEDEKDLITMDDWILANNVTAYILPGLSAADNRININAARYHVLMSLSDSMTKDAVLAIFRYRRKHDNYIKSLSELNTLPELQITTPEGITLYQELTGGGEGRTGVLKTEGTLYRIVGVGSVQFRSDKSSETVVVRKVTVLYDRSIKKMIYYSEE